MQEKPARLSRGGKNLLILGVLSIVIASLTIGVSLAIYHNSGDIYLDRSRPGFLPDKEEIDQNDDGEKETVYDFSKQEKITVDTLTEYLEHINKEIEAVDAYEKPFDMEIMSDEHFGIPSAEPEG